MKLFFILTVLTFYQSEAQKLRFAPASNPDEIISLPGLKTPPKFKQYSGYLNATIDGDRKLHYWFVESQNNPASDPVLLWLNGGPGCSSLDGFLSENGPFKVLDGGTGLVPNPYSWNTVANVLYLESPVGVGFSYSVSKNVTSNDDSVAKENYQALVNFFTKYPQFVKNKLFISGESYAGIYIPLLGVEILNGTEKLNLQGLAIGNGFYSRQHNADAVVYYAYYHGIVGHLLWQSLLKDCCSPQGCSFYNVSQACQPHVDQVLHFVNDIGLNDYSIYLDCAGGIRADSTTLKRFQFDLKSVTGSKIKEQPKMQHSRVNGTSFASIPYHQMYPQLGGELKCVDTTAETTYLNRADVQNALHIASGLPPWSVCSDAVHDAYTRIYNDMLPQFKTLLANYTFLVYNGDTDIVCPLNAASAFVADLNLNLTSEYRPWMYEKQVAGFVEVQGNLTLLTVKGSGHMVPQWRPPQALQMISNFLKGVPQ